MHSDRSDGWFAADLSACLPALPAWARAYWPRPISRDLETGQNIDEGEGEAAIAQSSFGASGR